jgi:hypothetical protein
LFDSPVGEKVSKSVFLEVAMKFACLVYQNESKIAHLSEADQLKAILAECEAAGAWNAELHKSGRHVFSAGLQNARTAKTVRKRGGKISVTDGPFAETREVFGGITVIEARDQSEALELVSKFASELLTVELRPVFDPSAELFDPLDQKIAAGLRREESPLHG